MDLGQLETLQSLTVTDNPSLDTTGLAALRTFETRLEGNAGEIANDPWVSRRGLREGVAGSALPGVRDAPREVAAPPRRGAAMAKGPC